MKPNSRRIMIGFILGAILATTSACGGTPAQLPATPTPNLPPTETFAPTLAPTDAFTPTFTSIPLFTVVNMVSNTTAETGKSPNYTLKAQTPFLQRSEDLRVTNFNNEMALLTQEEIAKFRDNLMQILPLPGSTGSAYDQTYKLLSAPGDLLSFKFEIYINIEGAAHPNTHSRTVTYNLEAGADVRLEQIFLPGSDYLGTIANYCIAQLKTRDIGFDAFSSGADPLPENYGSWNVTPDGLLITFDPYQVAAYAAGPQEVVIPYAELKSIIDPQGPLAQFLP
jgi:hypothetical protein